MADWLELLAQPIALIAWGLLVLVALSWRRPVPRAVRWLATAVTLVYFALATPLGANLAVGALERAAEPPRTCGAPVAGSTIVVLAGGISGVPASSDDFAKLHLASLRRVIEGTKLALSTPSSSMILSGGSGGAVREADLMASLSKALGFPAPRLLLERESATTAEAARNVARLLASRRGDGRVYLVTSAIHMRRASATFRRQGVDACLVPVDRRWVQPKPNEALLPQITALDKSLSAFHEIVGYEIYRATGRL